MPDMGHMYPNLMCAAGLQPAFYQTAKRRQIAQGLIMGDIACTAAFHDRLAFPVCGVAGQGGVYRAYQTVCWQAPDQRLIPPRPDHGPRTYRSAGHGRPRFWRHHHAGCVFIQSMHNTGPGHPANAGQAVAAMRQQAHSPACPSARPGRDAPPSLPVC